MKKHPEITDATKQAFVDSFLKLSREKPVEKISVRELTETAGYNRTTFYHYFPDVYGLYEYIQNYVFENIRGPIEENIRSLSDRETFVRNVTALTDRWRDYLAVLLRDPYSYRFSVQVKRTLIPYWSREFHLPEDDIRTSYRLDAYFSAIFSAVGRWVRHPEDMPAEDLAELLREIADSRLLRGIVTGVSE